MEYEYSLGRQTLVCPSCGKRRFKPYVGRDGHILDPTVGRCNRQFNCGYHLPPHLFFRNNPLKTSGLKGLRKSQAPSGFLSRESVMISPVRREQDVVRPLDYVEHHLLLKTLPADPDPQTSVNPLRRWLGGIFDHRIVKDVTTLYCLGDTSRMGGSAIFWYIDPQRRVRSGKIMAYDADGHRRKDDTHPQVCFIHRLINKNFNYSLCYYGVHLLPKNPEAKIIIVESEKTAIYLACVLRKYGAFPQRYIPVATGGCSRFIIHPEMVDSPGMPGYLGNDIRNRDIIVLPDADQTDRWRHEIAPWQRFNRTVRLFDLRSYTSQATADIADLLETRRSRVK